MSELTSDIVVKLKEFSHIVPGEIAFISVKNSSRRLKQKSAWDCTRIIGINARASELVSGRLKSFFVSNPYIKKGRPVPYIMEFICPDFVNLDMDGKIASIICGLNQIGKKFDGTLKEPLKKHKNNFESLTGYCINLAKTYSGSKPGIPQLLNFTFDDLIKNTTNPELCFEEPGFYEPQVYRVTWV